MAIKPDTQYPGKISPATPDYPYGSARNVTVPGDGTGTPWEKALVNDLLGFQQALLSEAGISPSGDPDKVGASQYLESIKKISGNAFDSVSALSSSELEVGGFAFTKGYYSPGDGGGGFYVVSGPSAVDEYKDHSLANGNVAMLQGDVPRLKQFGAVGDGVTDDDDQFQAYIDYLNSSEENTAELGDGAFVFSTTKSLTTKQRCIFGAVNQGVRLGSTRLRSTLIWAGGSAPMFDTTTSGHRFIGFGVESNGAATDFLEMNVGSQRVIMNDLFISFGAFTRSVVRSNGNRAGYSRFKNIVATKPAPAFIDIDGEGDPNGITPFRFEDCQFTGSNDDLISPWTVVKIKDETVEAVSFTGCTINSKDGVIIVDTSDTPEAVTLYNLTFERNEIDSAKFLINLFNLVNVENFSLRNNNIAGDGSMMHLASLVNSSVSSCDGNRWDSITYLFTADSDSRVRGLGFNGADWAQTQGLLDVADTAAGLTLLPQAPSIKINGIEWSNSEQGKYVLDITTGAAYTINIDTTKPESMEIGQNFTVIIQNNSAGVIAAPTFNPISFLSQSSAFIPPSAGMQTSISWTFDGAKAIQTSVQGPEVPII